MKSSSLALFSAISWACFVVSAFASPLLTISDNTALFFNGSSSIAANSNLTLNDRDKLSDLVFEARPGFEVVAGSPEVGTSFTLLASYTVRRYADYSEFNIDLPSVVASAVFQTPKIVTRASASYIENQANTRDARLLDTLLETKVITAGFETDYRATEKTSFVGGVRYRDTSRKVHGRDHSSITLPFNLYYAASEKLDIGLGYRFRDSSVASLSQADFGDRTSHFINLAIRGELTPKLMADLKLGYQVTDVDGADDFSGISVDGALAFAYSDKTSVNLTLAKDFLVGFFGEVIDNSMLALTWEYVPALDWSFFGTLGFSRDEYKRSIREQDYFFLKVGASYLPNQFFEVEGSFTFHDNDSNIDNLSFSGNIFELAVHLKY